MQSVNSLVSGLGQVKEEIDQIKKLKSIPAEDQFHRIMQVGVVFLQVYRLIYKEPLR